MIEPDRQPLSRYKLFETDDLDRAREEVSRVFCPHRLTSMGPRRESARHFRKDLGGLSLNFMTYGTRVRIEPGALERFYLLQVPLSGSALVRCGTQLVEASPTTATLLSPSMQTDMEWSADCRKLLVQIDRGRMERALEAMTGRSVTRAIEFDLAFPRHGSLERIIRLLLTLQEDLDESGYLVANSLAGRQMGEALIMALLGSHRHSHSAALSGPTALIAPRHVRRAEDYMRAHLADTITLHDLASATAVSIRALQDGFRRFRDTTPLETLRAMRMEAARRDLIVGMPGDCVTTIALRWGFAHLSRFSVNYRLRYNEAPSETLRARYLPSAPPAAQS